MKKTALLSALLLSAVVANAMDVKFDGQVRWRLENSNYGFDSDVDAHATQYLRTRVGMSAMPMDGLETYVQIQDSRTLGSNAGSSSTGYDANIDLKQAWFRWRCQMMPALSFQAGRYEWAKADQRFFAKRNWSNTGMSHEGWNLAFASPMATIELYWHTVNESFVNAQDQESFGVYVNDIAPDALPGKLDFFFDIEDYGENAAEDANSMTTIGLHFDGTFVDVLRAKVNFAMQSGTNEWGASDVDYAGMMYGLCLDYGLNMGMLNSVFFGYESMSGTDAADEMGWQELYPAYHAIHGISAAWNPATYGNGMTELKFGAKGMLPMQMSWMLSYHMFNSVEDMANGETAIGNELDLCFGRDLGNFKIDLGYAMASIDDELMSDPDSNNWLYLQMTAFIK